MRNSHSIVIVDDQTILREGLKALLSSHCDLKVVGEAGDGLEAVRAVRDHCPDLVLMDLSLPRMTGLDAIKEIKSANTQTKVIVLTAHNDEECIFSTLKAGADGYILKIAFSAELLAAIRHVLDGGHYLSPSIAATVISGFLQGKKAPGNRSGWEILTQRERQVMKLLAEGHKNRETADLLYISAKTVEKHRATLMKKLGMNDLAALTSLAIEKGLINQ
jgi:two-component system, NarL family, response regulator NreC